MNAFTTNDFVSLLDEMLARQPDPAPHPTIAVDVLAALGDGVEAAAPAALAEETYREFGARLKIEAEISSVLDDIEVLPDLPSAEPAAIARELDLKPGFGQRELDRIRRDFAFANHPDRVPARLRERAMLRMQIANRLIDDAKDRASAPLPA